MLWLELNVTQVFCGIVQCETWRSVTLCVYPPVCHGLNEEGLVLGDGSAPSLLGGVVHGEHIVPVHADGQHPIARTASSC